MAKPVRAFRLGVELERQIQPLYTALAHGIAQENIATGAVMPLATAATTGGEVAILMSAVNWWPTSFSAASSAGTQTLQVTHNLARAPVGFLNILFNPADAGFAGASVGQWNGTAVTFAVASFSATASFRLILL